MNLNKLYCIDAIKGLKKIPTGTIDMVHTDPPYNFKRGKDIKNNFFTRRHKKHLTNIESSFGHDYDPEKFLQQLPRIMNKMNAYIWTSKDILHVYLNWAVENGYDYNVLTWHKENSMPLWKNTYRPDTEYCVFIREKGAYFNSNILDKRKYKKYFITKIGTGAETRGINHPCPKPLSVVLPSIEISSRQGDVVLDAYVGSGTIPVGCKKLGRNYLGFDNNREFVDLAESRLKATRTIRQMVLV